MSMATERSRGDHAAGSQRDTGSRLGRVGKKGSDARAEVTISSDGMLASITMRPAVRQGRPLTHDYVEQVLSAAGVRHGIDQAAIDQAIAECLEGRVVENRTIARGRPPVADKPEQLVLQPKLSKSAESYPQITTGYEHDAGASEEADENRRLDYRSRSPFIVVKRGEELAYTRPFVPGEDGQTVSGEMVLRDSPEPPELRPGDNTVTENGRVLAACSGRFVSKGDAFWVEETLEIAGDVDYTTGHINFPGNVVITGLVKDRFRVWTGGSLECHGTLDAYEVFCRGSLSARGGIIGRRRGLVRVLGDVSAKFIENSTLECKQGVKVSRGILKSRVYTLDSITTGKRGRIVGSELRIGGSLHCAQLGNDAFAPARVACGVSFVAERRMAKLLERREQLHETLQELDRRLEISRTAKRERRRAHVVGLLEQLDEQAQSLNSELVCDREATITVEGPVYPGVTIEIANVVFRVEEPLKRVRFRLELESERVVYEQLS